jgi:hypothetical protein
MFAGYNCCVTCTLLKIAQKADGKKDGHEVVENGGVTTFCADTTDAGRVAYDIRITKIGTSPPGMHQNDMHTRRRGGVAFMLPDRLRAEDDNIEDVFTSPAEYLDLRGTNEFAQVLHGSRM